MSIVSAFLLLLSILWLFSYLILFAVDHGYIKLNVIEELLHYFKSNNIPFNNIHTIIMAILVISFVVSGKIT